MGKHASRWVIFAVCLMFCGIAGTGYAFGLISDTIKSRLNLKQDSIDVIATAGNIGTFSSIIPGIFNNHVRPQISLFIGITITTLGWGLLTLITIQIIDVDYTITAFANFMYQHGNSWMVTVCCATIVQNFPSQDRGKLLGVAKGYSHIYIYVLLFNVYHILNNAYRIFRVGISICCQH